MKKAAGLMAFIMTAVLMLSLCSCSSDVSPVETTTESSTESPAEVSTEEPTVSSSDDGFSDDVTGSVMQLMYDVIGEDQATAEKMVGEFFNVEPVDSLGNIMTDERNGIVTVMHVYTDMFVKDSVRFNVMQIWTDEKDGHVRRIELTLDNSGIISVPIEDTPEFQSEIKSLYDDVDGELKKSLGQPEMSGADWAYYEISKDRYAYAEYIDYTEPGGNGLVATSVVFADALVLLD